jgi:uncharacterized membrane protein
MSGLVTIFLIAAVAYLWRRLNRLQERLDGLELSGVHLQPAADIVMREAPADPPEPEKVAPTVAPATFIDRRESYVLESPEQRERREDPADPLEQEPERGKFGFEDVFGRRLPIWAGGITLAIAGMLIVKYSIDAGLVSPLVRVVSGLIFGFVLIGGAELALRQDERVGDPRVRQALSGAGVASLYGAILIAANLYELIDPVAAFLGMAAVTGLAMGLSLRFGAPSALLGLAGGLAAPALVGSAEPNIPLLVSYLALAIGGLSVLSKSQRWMWLGVTALAGGFGWAGLLLVSGTLDAVASISLGLFIILLGIVLPLFAFAGRLGNVVRIAGSIAAAAQIAGLVATGGFTLLHWGLFGLVSAVILWLASRDEGLARLPAVGLAIALMLLAAWPDPTPVRLAIVMVAGAVLYGVPALLALWRAKGSMLEAAEIAVIGAAGLIVPMVHFYRFDGVNDLALAGVALVSALLPAAAAAMGWRTELRDGDYRRVLLVTVSAVLVAAASALALPSWTLGPIVGLLGLGLLVLSLRADDRSMEISAWIFAGAGLWLLAAGFQSGEEIARVFGVHREADIAVALVRWCGLAAIFALFAWKAPARIGREIAQVVTALLTYGALAQLPLGAALPLVPALGLAATAYWSRALTVDRLLPAMGALLGVSLCWAAAPLVQWLAAGMASLVGSPMLVANVPAVQDTLLRLFMPAVLVGVALMTAGKQVGLLALRLALVSAGVMGAIALHILFKHVWSIGTTAEFVQMGLAERISWEALLLAAAVTAWSRHRSNWARVLTAAGLAHFAWYTMIVHNPMWAEQAVGSLPIVNWLLPAYGLPLLWLWLIGRCESGMSPMLGRIRSAAPMALLALFAFSTLRQLFHGSILTEPGMTEWEDILRSILGILMAIGFLMWGIVRGLRDWRIASLVIMILAVAKVFLFDASGLDGLLRISSFVALGLSLIGIGWLYSRYLGGKRNLSAQL